MNFFKFYNYFHAAIINEQVIDCFFYNENGCKPSEFLYLPRVSKWISFIWQPLRKFYILRKSVFFILFVFFVPFVFLYQFYSFAKDVFIKNTVVTSVTEVAFVTGDRSFNCINSVVDPSRDVFFISFLDFNKDSRVKNISKVLGFRSKFKALCYSLLALTITLLRFELKVFPQTYVAYRFFLMNEFLHYFKPSCIFITQHYDRWAVLYDSYCSFDANHGNISFTVVQHGIETDALFNFINKNNFNFYRLNSLNSLYVYNEGEHQCFRNNIFADKKMDVKICFYDVGVIVLSPTTFKNNKPTFLFIGHSLYEQLHIKLYETLSKEFDANFIYKQHPTVNASHKCKSLGWSIVTDNVFPDVDFVVSYQSTLALQYLKMNKLVYFHPDLDSLSYSEVQSDVINFFRSCYGLHANKY